MIDPLDPRLVAQILDQAYDPRPWLDVARQEYDPARPVIVLDRIEPGVPSDALPYCTHGRVTCMWCREWCWLGHASHDYVREGKANPICKECAHELKLAETSARIMNVKDHLRADGPH